jgi:hypothetical protein
MFAFAYAMPLALPRRRAMFLPAAYCFLDTSCCRHLLSFDASLAARHYFRHFAAIFFIIFDATLD